MKVELNFYKDSGKWYTKETFDIYDVDLLEFCMSENNLYIDMDYTIHIIEEDGFKQPYRLCKK